MPIYFVLADAHRRKLKAITEETAFGYGGDGLLDLLTRRRRTIEYEFRLFIPELAVARHRFVVEVEVIKRCAEERLRDLYDLGTCCHRVFVSMHSIPTIGSTIGIEQQVGLNHRLGLVAPGFLQPTRLWNPNAIGTTVPSDNALQRKLHRKRQLFLQARIDRHTPEN